MSLMDRYCFSLKSMYVLIAQLCSTLCDPMECSPPGSSVHGILQERLLEGLLVPYPGDLPDPGIKRWSPKLQVDSLPYEPPGKPSQKHEEKLTYTYSHTHSHLRKLCKSAGAFRDEHRSYQEMEVEPDCLTNLIEKHPYPQCNFYGICECAPWWFSQ